MQPYPKSQQLHKKEKAEIKLRSKALRISKKRKPLKLMSKKQKKELAKRAKLKKELIEESGGLCMKCQKPPDFRGLALIHKVPLARGGKTNRKNCYVGCGKCHAPNHGIKEV